MDKRIIAQRFAKARNTYAQEAHVQRQVAEKMLRLLLEATGMAEDGQKKATGFHRVVEVGCGTGCYSQLLLNRLNPDSLLLNDLCPEMKECVEEICTSPAVRFVPGDAEQTDFPPETDLITSCSTLQWFTDPAIFFRRCHTALRQDGILAFSTFGTENMRQIRQLTGHGLDYLSLEAWRAMLLPGFELLYAEEEHASLFFPTPEDVLRHLKQTGVTGTEKRIWTRGRLQVFSEEYIRRFSNTEGKVELTYHPIYIIAKKQ